MHRIATLWSGLLVGFLVAALPGAAVAQRTDTLIHVGAGNLFLTCRGSGSPTVVFESDAGEDSRGWAVVQERVAPVARACAYDRAGIGKSVPGEQTRSPADITRDFWILLDAAGITGPVVLVGHSIGGYLARIHAGAHPERVAGMVLVDPSTELFWERAEPFLPTLDWTMWGRSEQELRDAVAAVRRGRYPVIVLTSGQAGLTAAPGYQMDDLRRVWRETHAELAASYGTKGHHVVVGDSGHFIQKDHPEIVTKAILDVINGVP